MTALKWVRWDSEILHSPKFAMTPIDEFGCFAKLVLLAAVNDPPGVIDASVDEIALVLHVDPELVKRTLERLERFETVKRRRATWVFVNFARFNPAARFLSHSQRGSSHDDRGRNVATRRDGTDETRQDERIPSILAALYEARGLAADPEDAGRVVRLLADYPDRDVLLEAKKCADWTATGRQVKNFWLFFRNWLERSQPAQRERVEQTPEDIRRRLQVVS